MVDEYLELRWEICESKEMVSGCAWEEESSQRERRPVKWKRCNEGVEVEVENDQETTRQ